MEKTDFGGKIALKCSADKAGIFRVRMKVCL